MSKNETTGKKWHQRNQIYNHINEFFTWKSFCKCDYKILFMIQLYISGNKQCWQKKCRMLIDCFLLYMIRPASDLQHLINTFDMDNRYHWVAKSIHVMIMNIQHKNKLEWAWVTSIYHFCHHKKHITELKRQLGSFSECKWSIPQFFSWKTFWENINVLSAKKLYIECLN